VNIHPSAGIVDREKADLVLRERPDFSRPDYRSALAEWRAAVGASNVQTDEAHLTAVGTATFATRQRIAAVLAPASAAEVQDCVRIANRYRIPLYPISRGKNWGYGSRVPVGDGNVVVDLGRMNEIAEYDPVLAHVTVGPGVTQQQISEFLRARGDGLFMSITGGPSDSSLVGNTLERGVAKSPYGDRVAHVAGMEVVLPTGTVIRTGHSRYPNSPLGPVSEWGVGPAVNGLFSQSNLGIVTKMTFWLQPTPAFFQTIFFGIESDFQAAKAIDALQRLRLAGMALPVGLWNDYRMLATRSRYPWDRAGGVTPLPYEILQEEKRRLKIARWNGWGALYNMSREQGLADRKIITQALKGKVDSLLFIDDSRANWLLRFPGLFKWVSGRDANVMARLHRESSFKGFTENEFVAMAYWRKKGPLPPTMDADRDGCGTIWTYPSVPFQGDHVARLVQITEGICLRHGFEPKIALLCITARKINAAINPVHDRSVPGEDERAMACHHELIGALHRAGYLSSRLGIQSMSSLPPSNDDYGEFMMTMKRALDPNDVISPGRYDFRHEWPSSTRESRLGH
jgi:4-cresol dehydrogenase (hydroxylating)